MISMTNLSIKEASDRCNASKTSLISLDRNDSSILDSSQSKDIKKLKPLENLNENLIKKLVTIQYLELHTRSREGKKFNYASK